MVSAFDRVRNPQKIQEGRCSKFITEGFIICRWPTGPRNPPPPPMPTVHDCTATDSAICCCSVLLDPIDWYNMVTPSYTPFGYTVQYIISSYRVCFSV